MAFGVHLWATVVHSICADLPPHNLLSVRHYTMPCSHAHADLLKNCKLWLNEKKNEAEISTRAFPLESPSNKWALWRGWNPVSKEGIFEYYYTAYMLKHISPVSSVQMTLHDSQLSGSAVLLQGFIKPQVSINLCIVTHMEWERNAAE